MGILHRYRLPVLALFICLAGLWLGSSQGHAQTADPGLVEQGARLYAENCVMCHGPNGEGRVGATLAKNWPSIRPDLSIRAVIANGVPGSPMPAWSQAKGGPLSEADIDALVAYILSWETGEPFVPPATQPAVARPPITAIPQVEGDPNRGAALYDQNCAVCHGPNLEGRIGATLSKDWPGIRPDQSIKQTISNGVQGSVMPAWSQEHGGPLSETDVNDLVAFILSNEGGNTLVDTTAPRPSPFTPSWLSGWGGILLLVVGFILLVGIALAVQARSRGGSPS